MKWRLGKEHRRMIVRQDGQKPDSKDKFLGLMETPELAELVVAAVERFYDEWKSPAIGDTWRHRETRVLWRIEDCVQGGYLCRRRGAKAWTGHMSRKSAQELNIHFDREKTKNG